MGVLVGEQIVEAPQCVEADVLCATMAGTECLVPLKKGDHESYVGYLVRRLKYSRITS